MFDGCFFSSRSPKIPAEVPYLCLIDNHASILSQQGLIRIFPNPELVVACAFSKKGYCPAHNTKVSKPLSGDFDKDNALSRHRRIYFSTHAEQRRAMQESPFLLLTFIRDTGDIMNSISIPLYVEGKLWGNFCTGFSPELLLEDNQVV